VADAGYDAERDYRLCREQLGMRQTVIALNLRNAGDRWPAGPHRRAMRPASPGRIHRQRGHARSAFS
jgi:hypothetical protein